jgi:hypothetical protein
LCTASPKLRSTQTCPCFWLTHCNEQWIMTFWSMVTLWSVFAGFCLLGIAA